MSHGVDEEVELLNLYIELSEESDSDSYDSDDDDGEVGEIGEEENEIEVDDDQGYVGGMPRPYQHDPEPQRPAAAGQQGVAGAELGDDVGFRGNRDASRLDPRLANGLAVVLS